MARPAAWTARQEPYAEPQACAALRAGAEAVGADTGERPTLAKKSTIWGQAGWLTGRTRAGLQGCSRKRKEAERLAWPGRLWGVCLQIVLSRRRPPSGQRDKPGRLGPPGYRFRNIDGTVLPVLRAFVCLRHKSSGGVCFSTLCDTKQSFPPGDLVEHVCVLYSWLLAIDHRPWWLIKALRKSLVLSLPCISCVPS